MGNIIQSRLFKTAGNDGLSSSLLRLHNSRPAHSEELKSIRLGVLFCFKGRRKAGPDFTDEGTEGSDDLPSVTAASTEPVPDSRSF